MIGYKSRILFCTDVNVMPNGIFFLGDDGKNAGGETEGLVLEAKRRNKSVEKCNIVSGGHKFAVERSGRETGFRAKTSKTFNSNFTETSHFPYRPAPMLSSRHC